jgi:hypothetical protein
VAALDEASEEESKDEPRSQQNSKDARLKAGDKAKETSAEPIQPNSQAKTPVRSNNHLSAYEESKDAKTQKEAISDNSANVAFNSTLSKTPP